MKMNKNKGQSLIAILAGLAGFIAAVISPVIYIGGIKENVAVLDTRVAITESNIKEIKDNVEYIRRAIEQSNKGLIIKAFSELATSTSKK